jgi:hypothetical protein
MEIIHEVGTKPVDQERGPEQGQERDPEQGQGPDRELVIVKVHGQEKLTKPA